MKSSSCATGSPACNPMPTRIEGGHEPVLGLRDVTGRIRLHLRPLRGGVVGSVGFFPGLRALVAKDPDELIGLRRPGAKDLESTPASERSDQAPPFLKPRRHLARLDRVHPQLIRHVQRGSEFRLWPKVASPACGGG